MTKTMIKILTLLSFFIFQTGKANEEVTSENVLAWADGFFSEAMDKHRISGAGIMVAKNGDPLLTKGYGFQDLGKDLPFDALETRFRIGSNTKTFITTAVAQLLDRGLIKDLNDPVNNYLTRFKVEQNQGEDITFWDLMTHTAGYEDKVWHLGVSYDQDAPVDAAEAGIFKAELVRPRGLISTYGNYNTEVLSAAVEDITGQDIETYFKENIFEPLGMTKTRLPLDLSQNPDLAQPYSFFPNGDIQPVRFMAIHPFVASTGAIETTLDDISKYMQAQLDEGKTSNPLNISPETFKTMHEVHRSNDDRLGGFGMIFMVVEWNGQKSFGHGGSWPGFQSVMMMFPESGLTFFSVLLQPNLQANLSEKLGSMFMENRFTPKAGFVVESPMSPSEPYEAFMTNFWGPYQPPQAEITDPDLTKFVGSYSSDPQSNVERGLDLLSGGASGKVVELDGNGGLRINGIDGYIQTAPGIFHNPTLDHVNNMGGGEDGLYSFTPNRTGDGYRISKHLPMYSAYPVGFLDDPKALAGIFSTLMLVILTGLFSPLYFIKSDQKLKKYEPLGMALSLLMIYGFFLDFYSDGDGLAYHLLEGHPLRFNLAILSANVFFALTLWSCFRTYHSWSPAGVTLKSNIIGKIYLGLFSLSALVASLILIKFNLVGFHFL